MRNGGYRAQIDFIRRLPHAHIIAVRAGRHADHSRRQRHRLGEVADVVVRIRAGDAVDTPVFVVGAEFDDEVRVAEFRDDRIHRKVHVPVEGHRLDHHHGLFRQTGNRSAHDAVFFLLPAEEPEHIIPPRLAQAAVQKLQKGGRLVDDLALGSVGLINDLARFGEGENESVELRKLLARGLEAAAEVIFRELSGGVDASVLELFCKGLFHGIGEPEFVVPEVGLHAGGAGFFAESVQHIALVPDPVHRASGIRFLQPAFIFDEAVQIANRLLVHGCADVNFVKIQLDGFA